MTRKNHENKTLAKISAPTILIGHAARLVFTMSRYIGLGGGVGGEVASTLAI